MALESEALSLAFHTPVAAWTRAATGMTSSRGKPPRSLDVIIRSRVGRRHADVEASRDSDRKCIEWDIYVHEGAVDSSWTASSKRIGWLEGFGGWLSHLYPVDFLIDPVRCSATFELERSHYGNVLGLPKEMALGFDQLPRRVLSIGVEEADGRWWLETDPAEEHFTVGVGFSIERVAPTHLFQRAEREAASRVEKLITSRVTP
jgi:hypothetical protein